MESIVMVLSELVVAVKEEEEFEISDQEKRVDEELKQKIELLKEKTEKEFKEKHDVLELKKEIKAMKTINKDWFDKILRIDRNNEMRPKSCRVTRLTSRPKNIRTVSDSQITIPQQ
ncbi:hypothetical protein QTN25_009299 [Entamoeba marina]